LISSIIKSAIPVVRLSQTKIVLRLYLNYWGQTYNLEKNVRFIKVFNFILATISNTLVSWQL